MASETVGAGGVSDPAGPDGRGEPMEVTVEPDEEPAGLAANTPAIEVGEQMLTLASATRSRSANTPGSASSSNPRNVLPVSSVEKKDHPW